MQIDTKLDFNLISLEQEETINVLLELTAPELPGERRRDPATLQVVLDRSGSMGDGSLLAALQAIDSLLGRLRPDDRFGLVIFDNEVEVPVPAGALDDARGARAALRQIHPRGMTNLGGGLLRGIQEAQRVAADGGATLVLLSDGHANEGITDHDRLADFAAGAYRSGVASSTIGLGHAYDEDLLAAVSRGGGGNAAYAEQGDAAGGFLAKEVDGLLEQSVQAASLTVLPGEAVSAVRLLNDLPASPIEGGFMVELGGLTSAEARRLLLEVDVPAIGELGPRSVCELELRWVEVETMEQKLARIPVNVNVVPGDQAAGRVRDPEVETEAVFQQAQQEKQLASEDLRHGDLSQAVMRYREASRRLAGVRSRARGRAADDLDQEMETLDDLAERARSDAIGARKLSLVDHHMKTRRRGRRR